MENSHYFTPDFFTFLNELREHNERTWFESNRARFEQLVRTPFLRFIADLNAPLRRISPYLIADPRPVGGSMMRIHRDIRFSRDKSPYKDFVAAHFEHTKGEDGATPAFYLHLEPGGSSMVGAGMWRPAPPALKKIRDAIVAEPKRWQRVTSGADFRSSCGMAGESLKRPPVGYDPNHPLIEALKRKDFAVATPLSDREVCGPEFFDVVTETMRASTPFMQFLTEAVGLPFR